MNCSTLMHDRVSNGISVVRIFSMFWIVAVNYFSWLFRDLYSVDYAVATANSTNFITTMNENESVIDKISYMLAYSGWLGVVAFATVSGVSLWFSTLKKGTFKLNDYISSRICGIYVPYLLSIPVAVVIAYIIRGGEVFKSMGISALIMGGARFNDAAHVLNTPMWFVSLIILLYLAYPVFVFMYSKFNIKSIVIATAFLFVVNWFFAKQLGVFYPLMPFLIVFLVGFLFMHFIYNSPEQNKLFSIIAIPICFTTLLWMIYFEPQIKGVSMVNDYYFAGVVAMVLMFSVGYLLPVKWNKVLMYMSRGTLAVFLYHYLFIHPVVFATSWIKSLTVSLWLIYGSMLTVGVFMQSYVDKKIAQYIKPLFNKEIAC